MHAATDSGWAERFASLGRLASGGRFPEMLEACRRITADSAGNAAVIFEVGVVLMQTGFLGSARRCFEQVCRLTPDDPRPLANLAALEGQAGNHAASRRRYAALARLQPEHPVIRRNLLLSMEYDPTVSDGARLAQAREFGRWCVALAGGDQPRPPLRDPTGTPLRVGYVSADFCQHTVGLFVKDVLKAHDPARVTAFAYAAGRVFDWVTEEIRGATCFREVAGLDDRALAELIRRDGIDVLVDLSGHTAGSRLTVFARRPAPVLTSWLGYFATTGLPCVDAVFLDAWHAPPGVEQAFVERIVRLPTGRLCYRPVPFFPAEVGPPPCLATGRVTFCSFNNTSKLHAGVFDLWASVLAAVPGSHLVLKWRTFNDDGLRQSVLQAFVRRGLAAERIILRGPSFHRDVLGEYTGCDIALDPFPFTGGLTSCEALWMGLPVVTWPGRRVVSRQTMAVLAAIGLPELVAGDASDYVRIARELAADPDRLRLLRRGLRARMESSPLMDVAGFTRGLEEAIWDSYREVRKREGRPSPVCPSMWGTKQGG